MPVPFVWLCWIDFVREITTTTTRTTTITGTEPLEHATQSTSFILSSFLFIQSSFRPFFGSHWHLARLSLWCFHLYKIEHLTGNCKQIIALAVTSAESRVPPFRSCHRMWHGNWREGKGTWQGKSQSRCHCHCIHLKDYKRICRLFAAKWTHLLAPRDGERESGRVGEWENEWAGERERVVNKEFGWLGGLQWTYRAFARFLWPMNRWMNAWQTEKLTDWVSDWLTDSLSGRSGDQWVGWFVDWFAGWLGESAHGVT